MDGVIEARVRVGARLPGATQRVLTFAFFQINNAFFPDLARPKDARRGVARRLSGDWSGAVGSWGRTMLERFMPMVMLRSQR